MDFLNEIGKEFANVEQVREQLFTPKVVQLHPNIPTFESPESYGIYKSTGGKALGVVGKVYNPMNLHFMLDSIVRATTECNLDLDLSTLKFREYKGGAKVAFSLDLPTKEIEGSPMVGDIVKRSIEFRTGFDGKTKTSITEKFFRLWCENGCTSAFSEEIAYKNTFGNQTKIMNLCNYLESSVNRSNDFILNLGKLAEIEVTQTEIDKFIKDVTGIDAKEYKEMSTRKKNILDSINQSIGIELANTGANRFSLLNGFTRYATHESAKGDEEKLYYSSTAKQNDRAVALSLAQLQ